MAKSRHALTALASTLIVGLGVVPIVLVTATPAAAADITTACPGTTTGTIFTLSANCGPVTAPLTVPNGFTIDGAGHTVSANDAGGTQWDGGGIVTSAGATMNIRNLNITGPVGGFQICRNSGFLLYGIWFNDAGGTVDNVTVDHIYQFQDGTFASCQTGRAIRADGATPGRRVTITNTKVMDYQKSGFESRGTTTMNISGSTAGPPHPLEGLNAQNGVSFVGVTAGTVENNTIHGSSDEAPGPPGCGNCSPAASTGMLLSNADNVTVTGNTFVGNGTDIGVAVSTESTGNTISFNHVTRTPSTNPANTDSEGFGISVDSAEEPPSSATLICNTFSGWNQNIVGAIQIACTPLPNGTECVAYSAHAPTVEGDGRQPFTWTVPPGTLPPGLTLAPNGTIGGTPPDTTAGTYKFTLKVVTANNFTATSHQTITIAPGCATPIPPPTNTPDVRTVSSHRRVTPGQPFHDRIIVRGLAGEHGATAVARLYGPFTSRGAATCDAAFRVRAQALHVQNGNQHTPDVRIATPGVYTWRVTLLVDAANRSVTHRCGQAVETTVVAKAVYVAPIIKGGFSGTLESPGFAARPPATVSIQMPAIGMDAVVRPERVTAGQMTLPGDVGEVGWLRKSAGIGDKIGTAVIGGHVSDRHDNPGALFHLSRAHAGQQVTVIQAGTRHQFMVVRKATFDRRDQLPDRYFVTTGRHRLVLISCTAKVVAPNGQFHYTRYIVVVANQVRRHS